MAELVGLERRVEKLEDIMQSQEIRLTVAENNIKDMKDDIKEVKVTQKEIANNISSMTRWLAATLIGGGLTLAIGVIGFLIQRGLH